MKMLSDLCSLISNNKGKFFIVCVSLIVSIICVVLILYYYNKDVADVNKIESSAVESIESTTDINVIEVEETTEHIEIVEENTESFIVSDSEPLYHDFLNENVAKKYADGIYLKSTLTVDEDVLNDVIELLSKKNVPLPYRIDTVSDNYIYIIHDERGYGFDFSGNQNIVEDESSIQDNSDEIDESKYDNVEETESEEDELEEVVDFEDIFIEEYGDICVWVQEQIDGYKSESQFVHPHEEINEGVWSFKDSRDGSVYIINYDTFGEPSSVEHYNQR